jgi:tRNA A37 threonylcarbamoyladenosine dehydratase
LHDINPDTVIIKRNEFIDRDKAQAIAIQQEIDFVADCIDSIAYKTVFFPFLSKLSYVPLLTKLSYVPLLSKLSYFPLLSKLLCPLLQN